MAVMGRVRRVDVGGMVYHVLNRANFRSRLFKSPAHYQDFLGIVEESLNFVPMRILAYCLMPNHWHLVLYPASGRRPREVPATDHPDPHAALSREDPDGGIWPRLPGPLQVAAGRIGQPFPGVGSLRGKERQASG